MNKQKKLKCARLFLKMAKCDFALIRFFKVMKALLCAMLFVNIAVFSALLLCKMDRLEK